MYGHRGDRGDPWTDKFLADVLFFYPPSRLTKTVNLFLLFILSCRVNFGSIQFCVNFCRRPSYCPNSVLFYHVVSTPSFIMGQFTNLMRIRINGPAVDKFDAAKYSQKWIALNGMRTDDPTQIRKPKIPRDVLDLENDDDDEPNEYLEPSHLF